MLSQRGDLPCFDGARPPHPSGTPAKIITTSFDHHPVDHHPVGHDDEDHVGHVPDDQDHEWHAGQNNHNFFIVMMMSMTMIMIVMIRIQPKL